MRKLFILAVLVLAALPAAAQEATLNAPVARNSEAKQTVSQLTIIASPAQVNVEVSVKDASNVEIRRQTYVIPDAAHPGATVGGFVTALINVRATETGSDPRKANFRVLGYLSDQGYLPGVTLVP